METQPNTKLSFILRLADSEELAAIHVKLEEAGFPNDVDAVDVLTPVERRRYKSIQYVNMVANSNTLYQYELGLIDRRSYESSLGIFSSMGPAWEKLGIPFQQPRSDA